MCEKVLANDLTVECESLGIIPDFQFGFRPRHATSHPLLRIIRCVGKCMNDGKYSLLVTLDIEKAFDTTLAFYTK